jgi:hypothetical protein
MRALYTPHSWKRPVSTSKSACGCQLAPFHNGRLQIAPDRGPHATSHLRASTPRNAKMTLLAKIISTTALPRISKLYNFPARLLLDTHAWYPKPSSSFLMESSVPIFLIWVSSNFSPPACLIFKSSIALIFFSRLRTFLSCELPPPGDVTVRSGVNAGVGA